MRWLLTMAILVSAVQAACADDLPIDVYDLTGALQFDATNPTETARVWDHVHAIATLQGIVNRDAPRLYVRFVRAGGRNLNDRGLDAYSRFSPNGIVPQKVPPSLLHGKMPVMRADYDLGDSASKGAATVADRVRVRQLPFSWFRGILKTPAWYMQVYETARSIDPDIHLLDAPTFFELYRIFLQNHPEAAAGQVPLVGPAGE
jgi:hypothetical protein